MPKLSSVEIWVGGYSPGELLATRSCNACSKQTQVLKIAQLQLAYQFILVALALGFGRIDGALEDSAAQTGTMEQVVAEQS